MSDPVLKTTHVTDGLKRLLWQFRDRPNLRAIVQSYLEQIQELENVIYSLMVERYVLSAVGVQLDGIGKIVGELRQNRTDTDYRVAILGRISRNKAHSRIEDIIALFVLLLPTFTFELTEGTGPAAFRFRVNEALTPVTDPSPAVLDAQLQDAKGGGIKAHLLYGLSPRTTLFKFAPGAVPVPSARGLGNAAQTSGGKFSGIVS